MNREAFEKLVSDWLDEPRSVELRARLDAAIAGQPQLARLRDELARADTLIRAGLNVLPPVAWERLKARIRAQIDRIGAVPDLDTLLDHKLRESGGVEGHVDWGVFQRKVSLAVDRNVDRPRVVRLSRWRVGVAAGMLAAAAAVALMFSMPGAPPPATNDATPATGYVRVEVLPPADWESAPARAVGIARVEVIEQPEWEAVQVAASSEPEVFFMLEPSDTPVMMASLGGYGSP